MNVCADLHVNMYLFALLLPVIIIVWFLSRGSFPLPASVLYKTVDGNSPLSFSESSVEEAFASDGEVSATSIYNHTLVIGSIHTGLTVCRVQPRLMDCYMQRSKSTFIYLFIRTMLKCTVEIIS